MINIHTVACPSAPRPRGRPRAFDRDQALDRAAETFWRLGYEGASIVDLTAAMGVTPQSLYAAFGCKAELYRGALARYRATEGAFFACALDQEPTAAKAFERAFAEAVHAYSRPGRPRGCMLANAALACAAEHQDIAAHVAALRADMMAAIRARLERGQQDGDLATDADPPSLARYLLALLQGLSQQARDGAGEADLAAAAAYATAELTRLSR